MKNILVTAFLASVTLSGAWAQDNAGTEETAGEMPEKVSIADVRAAITDAILYFRFQSIKDSDDFFVPPERTRRVIRREYVDVTRRYRKVQRKEPVYDYEYETYTTMEVDKSGSSVGAAAELKKVTKRRVVGRRQVGTRTVTRLVRDSNGPIAKTRTHRKDIWGPGGPDELHPGWYAQNAMAVYLQLRAGLDLTDERLAESVFSLANYVEAFGIPDRTWDLAWLTAAFVNLPKDNEIYNNLSKELVNKVLLGQINDGRGEGMWGPVCVNPELVAAMIKAERELAKEHIREWEDRLKRSGDREKYAPKIMAGRRIVDEFHKKLVKYSRRALDFEEWNEPSHRQPDDHIRARNDWQMNSAKIYGFPMYIYGEMTADMESTSLALFALREAKKNGYLPDAPTVPKGYRDRPVMHVNSTERIIRRAADAIAGRQAPNGTFSQSIVWQPVRAFNDIGLPGLPMKDTTEIAGRSKVTLLSTAQGYTALADAVTLLDGAGGRYRRQLMLSNNVVKDMANALITGDTKGLKVGDDKLGSYAFAFTMGRLLESSGGNTGDNRELWWKLTDYLLKRRDDKENVWVTGNKDMRTYTPSVGELLKIREKQKAGGNDRKLKRIRRHNNRNVSMWFDGRAPATVYSGLLLLQGVRPPVVGAWSWHGNTPRTNTFDPVLRKLEEENGVRLNYVELGPDLPIQQAREVPILFASGAGGFEHAAPGEYEENLRNFLTHDGILIAEGPASADGNAFFEPLKEKILEIVPNAQAINVPAGEGLPTIEGIRGPNGRMIAAFLKIGAPESMEGAMAPGQAMQFVYNLLNARIDQELLNRDYAIYWPIIEMEEERFLAELEEAQAKEDD